MIPAWGVTVTDYLDLVRAIRQERQAQGLSCEEVDDLAGLPDRYMNKLENPKSLNGRSMGEGSLPLVLRTLGLKLVLMRDEEPRLKQRAA